MSFKKPSSSRLEEPVTAKIYVTFGMLDKVKFFKSKACAVQNYTIQRLSPDSRQPHNRTVMYVCLNPNTYTFFPHKLIFSHYCYAS